MFYINCFTRLQYFFVELSVYKTARKITGCGSSHCLGFHKGFYITRGPASGNCLLPFLTHLFLQPALPELQLPFLNLHLAQTPAYG